ncbi:MAG TPA: hypothetical protein VFR85_07410 [Anaeromyxobacteraceae bacterium]|nr:hypothetical protein [Anaeromyxobacteraceae bacterium]
MRRQDEVEARLENLLGAGAGVGVRERRAGLLQLRQEATRHGDVEPAQVGGQRLGDVAAAVGRGERWHDPDGAFQFYWLNWLRWLSPRRVGLAVRCRDAYPHLQRSRHLPQGDDRGRAQLDGHLARLAPRPMEEPGEDLGEVLPGRDPGELHHAAQAEPPVSERLDHLGEALDEPSRDLAKVSRSLGETELAVKEEEEAGVAEVLPELPAIEVGEGQEEVGHRRVLAPEQIGEPGGEVVGV